MSRGLCTIILQRPKFPENIAAALRSAHAFGADLVMLWDPRCEEHKWRKHAANTPKAHRHMPIVICDDLTWPVGGQRVIVERTPESDPLPTFQHPSSAVYVFGPEDGNVSGDALAYAHGRALEIPTQFSLNLAHAVTTVLYDRSAKRFV